jgi:hypothetical protein
MIEDTSELLELSDAVCEFANRFESCPSMQAIIHGAFTLYLSGSTGLMYLVMLAANMGELTDSAIECEREHLDD